ncbi:MAG: MBL fold metallo-hydrolase [Proteobacteria bacterium]|nr:MBL fold metallo-hydrolase [Pseudomonadota bacterium]
MHITFCGAAQQVTGSCFLFETSATRFLVDCGLFQGHAATRARNLEPFAFDPLGIDFVILTHAHLDHSGLLPRLGAQGFKGPIYTTSATRDLLPVLLLDSAHLQEMEAERATRRHRDPRVAYDVDDVDHVLKQVQPIPYDVPSKLAPGVEVILRDAGHILGSAIVELSITEGGRSKKVVVSGDLGQTGRPILRDPAVIREADVLLLESTYGDRNHKSLPDTLDELTGILNPALSSGVVLVPSFAVGRAQELLYYLNRLARDSRVGKLNVFVDSPMAQQVTAITAHHLELFNDEARRLAAGGAAPGAPSIRVHFTDHVQDSIALNRIEAGAVILAGSGMCDGGRIRHHLRQRLPNPHTTVLIVGFQAMGTLGRELVDGARSVRLFGEDVPVRARIATLGGFSAHADQSALLGWLSQLSAAPRHLFLVHGEPRSCGGLAAAIKSRLGWEARIPADAERVEV